LADAPHGFELPPDEHRLLRGAPPPGALAWVAAAVGGGARVHSVSPLEGGTSSAVHAVLVQGRDGPPRELILRRFVRREWLAEEPDIAAREAAVLSLLETSGLPVPRLVAVDPDGVHAGAPAVLMTRLPGRIEWQAADLAPYLAKLAAVLPRIHETPLPAAGAPPPYRPYPLEMRRPPRWATLPEVWQRAMVVHEGPAPAAGHALIHRDYHPGNVLWVGGAVSGIIDWPVASVGVPEADVGHCRVNLRGRFGPEAADRFLEAYRAVSGRREYHPYWDIVAALGGLDEACDARPEPADERFLAAAVAQLG